MCRKTVMLMMASVMVLSVTGCGLGATKAPAAESPESSESSESSETSETSESSEAGGVYKQYADTGQNK